MTNNTIPLPHDHHRLQPLHEEMDQLQALAVKPQVKRQVRRRRTHTSRPYQERLLNMAEARREIVTALKIHRVSSTRHHQHQQSTYLHHHQEPPLQLQLQQQQQEEKQKAAFQDNRSQPAVDEEEASSLARTTTMSYADASFANSNPLCKCNSPPAHWNWPIAAGSYYCCSPPPPPTILRRLPCDHLDLRSHELPPTAAMGGLVELEHCQGGLERLVRSLPTQPLGLNLTFQGFGVSVDDDGAKDDREDLLGSLPLTQPSPAVETTATTHACAPSPPALSATTDAGSYSVIDAPAAAAALVSALDGGEMMMVQQASTGIETQGVECSEAAAADVAAWWSKIFESMESAPQSASRNAAEDVTEAPGLPAEWRWLCGDDVGLGEQAGAVTGGKPSPDALGTTMHVDVDDDGGGGDGDCSCCCYEGGRRSDDGEDVTLPCMDGIGDDTQGWDGEWFSS